MFSHVVMIFVYILLRYVANVVPANSLFTFGATCFNHVLRSAVSILCFFSDFFY